MAKILENIKVLDLSRVLAGPWCTQSLADMGATVYKIERPGVGDEMRHSPPFLNDKEGVQTTDSTSFAAVNRGKYSITVDISSETGQEIIKKLVAQCDVLVENYKVGDLKRYGLDYDSVKKIRPDLIYCSITGYGQDGPMAEKPGYDPVFQAITGIMESCGLPDDVPGGGPMRATVPFIDVMTGMTATTAVMAALYHRHATGEGQSLDIALLDVAIAATAHHAQTYLSTGKVSKRVGNGSFLFAPSNCYMCADGKRILIQIGNDLQWNRFCKAISLDLDSLDYKFKTNAERMANVTALDKLVTKITMDWRADDLAAKLSAAGVPCGPVNTIADAFDHPQVKHREIRVDVEHPTYGSLPHVRSPLRFSRTPVRHRAIPALGADTERVLMEVLSIDTSEVSKLKMDGVI